MRNIAAAYDERRADMQKRIREGGPFSALHWDAYPKPWHELDLSDPFEQRVVLRAMGLTCPPPSLPQRDETDEFDPAAISENEHHFQLRSTAFAQGAFIAGAAALIGAYRIWRNDEMLTMAVASLAFALFILWVLTGEATVSRRNK